LINEPISPAQRRAPGKWASVPPAFAGVPFELDGKLSAFGLRLQRDSTFTPKH
jgi:hypothetical protein